MTHIKWVSYSSIDSHPCFSVFIVYQLDCINATFTAFILWADRNALQSF